MLHILSETLRSFDFDEPTKELWSRYIDVMIFHLVWGLEEKPHKMCSEEDLKKKTSSTIQQAKVDEIKV